MYTTIQTLFSCHLNYLPTINKYLLLTPATPITDIVAAYYIFQDYQDLDEACQGPETYIQPSFGQKEVHRKETTVKPAPRHGEERLYQMKVKLDKVGTERPIQLLPNNYTS